MRNMITRFMKSEEGATAIEYGLIASLVAVAIVAALTALGGGLKTVFASVTSSL
jgi:pilus assembly protein Flp/PilA